jgi:E3 ubiquitin-protein ligase RNF5
MEKKNSYSGEQKIFECSICLETAKEPVITKCGHIFCWPCLYEWFESKGNQTTCPNCKNPIHKDDIIPIYTKDENKNNSKKGFDIPRPKAQRNSNNNNNNNNFFSNSNFNFGFGFFPFSGFNINFNNFNNENEYNNYNNNNNSFFDGMNENEKKYISNLLILLFMIFFWINFV